MPALTTTSNTRLVAQSSPAKTGGRSSKSGTPWPGTYSTRCVRRSIVVGATRTFTPARFACSTRSSRSWSRTSTPLTISSSGRRRSSSCGRSHDAAEHRQHGALVVVVGDCAEELVVDSAAALAERAPQVDEPLARAEQHRAAPHAGEPPHVAGHELVRRTQPADQRAPQSTNAVT